MRSLKNEYSSEHSLYDMKKKLSFQVKPTDGGSEIDDGIQGHLMFALPTLDYSSQRDVHIGGELGQKVVSKICRSLRGLPGKR